MGIEAMTAETCYPIKVSHGHVKELIGKTRYLFLPSIVNMAGATASETGFFCPLVQANQYMVRMALDLDKRNLLKPVLHLKHDLPTLALELSEQIGGRSGAEQGADPMRPSGTAWSGRTIHPGDAPEGERDPGRSRPGPGAPPGDRHGAALQPL